LREHSAHHRPGKSVETLTLGLEQAHENSGGVDPSEDLLWEWS
jgi:hypothetical protein